MSTQSATHVSLADGVPPEAVNSHCQWTRTSSGVVAQVCPLVFAPDVTIHNVERRSWLRQLRAAYGQSLNCTCIKDISFFFAIEWTCKGSPPPRQCRDAIGSDRITKGKPISSEKQRVLFLKNRLVVQRVENVSQGRKIHSVDMWMAVFGRRGRGQTT